MVSYADSAPCTGCYEVTYIVKETGAKLIRSFDSERECARFINKLRHSKKCILVSWPYLN